MVEYKAVTNPRWLDAAHMKIACDVVFPHLGDAPFPFIADGGDQHAHGRDIFERAKRGEFGTVTPYAEPIETPEQVAAKIDRIARERMAAPYGDRWRSYQSYFLRLSSIAPADRTAEQIVDLGVMIAADQWEEDMLSHAAELAEALDLGGAMKAGAWPEVPAGLAAIIAAC